MSCEFWLSPRFRTEHGNVIARDNRDNRGLCFAGYSTAALILAAVTLYTERKAYEKRPATHRPGPGTMAFRSTQPTRYSAVKPRYHRQCFNRGTLPLLSCRTVTHRFILEDSLAITADG